MQILVVDDEVSIVKMLTNVLTKNNHVVISTSDPKEAVKHAHVDLALLDVIMPEISGIEVLSQLRSINPELRVIFMSGHLFDKVIPEGIPLLRKPFVLKDLFKLIQ